MQLLPLPHNATTTLASCNVPARLTISGRVNMVDSDLTTFYVSVPPTNPADTSSTELHVRATISPNFVGPPRFAFVPPRCHVVSFTGTFVSFHVNTAVVEADDLTYLGRPHGRIHAQNAAAHFVQRMESLD